MLFVSHNMASIDRLCRTCVLFDSGNLLSLGETPAILDAYLSLVRSKTSNVYAQPGDPDKAVNLRRVVVSANGSEGHSEIRFDEEFEIVVDYEINEPVRGAAASIAIVTASGVILLASAEYDMHPELLHVRDPGYYRTSVKIPGRLLNAGHYSVRVFALDVLRSHAFDRVDAVVFTITGTATHLGVGSRAAHLVPLLDWNTVSCS